MTVMVEIYKTTTEKVRGKLCHFEKNDFIRHGLSGYYWKTIGTFDNEKLKELVVEILTKEGFVFFDKIDYKVISHFGKLHEFAVNYKYIT